MKKIFILFSFLFICYKFSFCKDGDTIKIYTIRFGEPKFGWFDFPDTTKKFQKILMNYKIKCPCGEWDYLAMVFVKQFFAPSFRVDSAVVQEYSFMFDTSWNYIARKEGGKVVVDSFPKKPRLLEFYLDKSNPTRRTSFIYVWDVYYRYIFDQEGNKIDSILVPPDSTIYLEKTRIFFEDPIAITERFEIMRYVTPYGIGLDVGEGFTWTMDVTDFAPLLTGRVYLDAPNQQEPIEITFDFIEGIPERNIIRLERIYDFYDVVYDADFENKISKKQIHVSPNEKMFKLKVIQTGHGFGGNEDNCCEFCKKNAYVKVNDTIRYTREVWRKCSNNPLYPQGGTWIFARSNWCPGAEVQPFDFELTPFVGRNRSFTFDYDMDYYDKPYSSGSNTIGRWIITAYVITYSDHNFNLDAEIYDIVQPSKKDVYKRMNPISTSPLILVKNRGKEEIKSIKFKYGILGGKEYSFNSNISIKPFEIKYIALPSLDCSEWKTDSRTFKVEILQVNGKEDDYPYNNIGYSEFEPPPSIYKNIIVSVRTNNFNVLPFDTAEFRYNFRLYNKDDLVVSEYYYVYPSSDYSTVLNLLEGCYEMYFVSRYECGLGFWYYRYLFGLTDGLFQLLSDDLVLFKPNIDFGSHIHYAFIAEDQPTVLSIPDTIDFGNVYLGNEYYKEAIIKPANKREISIWDFKIVLGETKGFTIERIEPQVGSNQKINLAEGDSARIVVKLNPKKLGKVTSNLTFSSNDRKKPLVSIPIKAFVMDQSGVNEWNDNFELIVIEKKKNVYEFLVSSDDVSNLTCQIYNVLGKKISQINCNLEFNQKFEISFDGFPSGIYFVQLQTKRKFKVIPVLIW